MLIIILEIKKGKCVPANAIAQTIGYFIASNVHVEVQDIKHKLKPAMGLVISHYKCRFYFFPFKTEVDQPCLDALVSKEFPILKNSFLNFENK